LVTAEWQDGRRTLTGEAMKIRLLTPTITSKKMRVLNKWLFWLWVFPGVPVSIYFRNSVAWVVFLSVYAIIVAHLIEWRQEAESTK
jgi:hypothetical protein